MKTFGERNHGCWLFERGPDSQMVRCLLGHVMNYRIENKPEMVLTGYKRRFTGTPAERNEQEEKFYLSTRVNQFILNGLSKDCEISYNVITNFGDDGYDYYIAAKLDTNTTNHLARALGSKEEAKRFETS